MAKRRIWRRKPEAEKERRRKMAQEKQKSSSLNPEIEARYRRLSPMMKETVDNLVSSGLSMEKVINGINS